MLTKLRARMAYHLQAGLSSLLILRRKPLATLMTIIVIAITLTLPTLFWVATDNLQQLTQDWQRGGHIALYLDSSSTFAQEQALLSRIRETPGVSEAIYISAEEGLIQLQRQEGMQDIMSYLPENPLPAVIDVIPSGDVKHSEKLDELYQTLKSYPHVEQAKYDVQWVNKLYTFLDVAAKISQGLMILLALAVVLIIGNTLRLAIRNRQEEINVLTLIGASKAYIIRPFLYLGVFYSVAGALLAIGIVHIIILSLTILADQVAAAYQMNVTLMGLTVRQSFWVLIAAIGMGWFGARISVHKV